MDTRERPSLPPGLLDTLLEEDGRRSACELEALRCRLEVLLRQLDQPAVLYAIAGEMLALGG